MATPLELNPCENDGSVSFGYRFRYSRDTFCREVGSGKMTFLPLERLAIYWSKRLLANVWRPVGSCFGCCLLCGGRINLCSILPMRVAQNMVLAFGYQRRRILLGRRDI